MAGSIYFDVNNYAAGANGRLYFNDIYLCNYPMLSTWLSDSVQVSFVNGSSLITLTGSTSGTASFFDLYGSNTDIQTNIAYPYLLTQTGVIVKIKQILSATTAILESAYPTTDTTTTCLIVDYFGQPAISSTVIGNSSDATQGSISISTEYSYDSLASFAPGQIVEMGTSPIALYMDGVAMFMLITF